MMPAQRCIHDCWLPVAAVLAILLSTAASADEPPPPPAAEVSRLIAELNSDRFDIRERAADKLRTLAEQPAAHLLAQMLGEVLLAADTPYEVRVLCEPILMRLPAPPRQPGPEITAPEIDQRLEQIDAPSYGLRSGATLRLNWAAQSNPQLARLISDKLKRRLADGSVSSDARQRLSQLRETAFATWLASDPATWPAPAATETNVQDWIKVLAADSATAAAQQAAERELLDVLVYGEWTPKIASLLSAQLDRDDLSPAARDRLTDVYAKSLPGMAAEIWVDHSHHTLQYLLVNVPQVPEGATRATHFDRIDDNSAHCVSGNSLAPGDYPVGVALPPTHPQTQLKEGRAFHLVNLPDARRRLLYEHRHLKTDERERLRESSERTTAWFLKRNECLSEREIALLRQLDAGAVSRFVGPYLLAVDDQPIAEPDVFQFGGRGSRHALLCGVLAEMGTHEALAGLVEAGRRDRLPEATDDFRFRVGWLAAFAIAERDPWPGLDDWLADLIETKVPLTSGQDAPPEVARRRLPCCSRGMVRRSKSSASSKPPTSICAAWEFRPAGSPRLSPGSRCSTGGEREKSI